MGHLHFERRLNIIVLLVLLVFSIVCSGLFIAVTAENRKSIKMATTTSTDNTGLLDVLKPAFETATGIELICLATGTGKALKHGENCDVDLLMVHAPDAEKKYVGKGFGINREEFMYNDFVIIGPEDDPAGVRDKTISQSLRRISDNKQIFVSRGDNSGTHKKEMGLWHTAGLPVPDKEKWYVQTGQGMLATIILAQEQKGYTLADRGTYVKYEAGQKNKPFLQIFVEGEKDLLNQYSVIAVNPKNCPDAEYDLAMIFIKWITGPEAQDLIREFKLMGKPLFTPNAKQ